MNFKHILLGLLVFCAAALVGLKTNTSSETREAPQSDQRGRTRQLSSTQPLGKLRGQRTEGHRMRTAIEMARNLPSSEIKEWLETEKFNYREGFAMTLFQKIAFERWSREEPAEFLSWAFVNGVSDYRKHLDILVKNHPDIVQEFLASLDNPGHQSRFLSLIVKEQPDLALAGLKDLLSSPANKTTNFQSLFKNLLKAHPAELEKMLGEIEGPARTSLEAVIIERDLSKDFAGTLDQLLELPDGYHHLLGRYHYHNQNSVDADLLLSRLGDFPPSWKNHLANNSHYFFNFVKSIEQFANINWEDAGFTDVQTSKLTKSFLQRMVQRKPEQVLARLDDFQLSDNEKNFIFRGLSYRSRSEEELANIKNALSDSKDLELLDKILSKSSHSGNLSIETPDDVLTTLASGNEIKNANFLYRWNSKQKQELANSFSTLEGSKKDHLAAFLAPRDNGFPLETRGEAIEHLLNSPETLENWNRNSRVANNSVSGHALALMHADSSKATSWLAKLPESPVRLQAQKNLAYNWHNYEPEAARQWVDSLPATERAEINKFLKEKASY